MPSVNIGRIDIHAELSKYDKLSKIVSYLLVPPSSIPVLDAMYKQMFTNWGITSET